MEKIKVGVIGVGHLGQHHTRVYTELENTELIGIADIDIKRGEEIANKFQTKFYSDYQDLLSHCDAINVVVPTSEHHKVVLDCLNAGLHTLVEKPISKTIAEAEEMVKLANEKKLILQVGHIERYNPAVRALTGVLDNPLFIETHRLAPFRPRGTDVAVVLDLMIHDIDIILTVVKSNVISIEASGIPVLSGNIDIANARIVFANNCTANVTASRVSLEQIRKIRFFQHNAYISLDYGKTIVDVYQKKAELAEQLLRSNDGYTHLKSISEEPISLEQLIQYKRLKVDKKESLKVELADFIDSVQNKRHPTVSGEDGLKALSVALEIMNKINIGLGKIEK